ncbi:hypothetical protein SLE2022_334700 [Rubroshorea leprosula]
MSSRRSGRPCVRSVANYKTSLLITNVKPSSSTEHQGGSNVGIRPDNHVRLHGTGPTAHPLAQDDEMCSCGQ